MTHGNQDHGYARVGKRRAEHVAWTAMIDRCNNPRNISYKWYGAKGISVAPEWVGNFRAFIEHVGDKPGPEYSLDRIDRNGNYEPGNVRWATEKQQQRNRGSNKLDILDARLIRHWAKCGYTDSEIAGAFKVSRTLIRNIKTNKCWTEESL